MRNDKFLQHSLNVYFEEILAMNELEFRQWCIDIRELVVKLWDEESLPPRVGFTEEEAAEQFRQMEGFPVYTFKVKDEYAPETGPVVRNTYILGNAVNDWFPTMMKTKINYTADESQGKAIYDFFADDDKLETFITYAHRHFHRDSFYAYSRPIKPGFDLKFDLIFPPSRTGKEWLFDMLFSQWGFKDKGWDYWLCPIQDKEYTGYNEEIKSQEFLRIDYDTIHEFMKGIDLKKNYHRFSNVDPERSRLYTIRVYEKGQKLFPIGLKAWRVSFCQYAVNFPPLTAKYIYEQYTKDFPDEEIVVYDPSMGWGGRLLGAMSYSVPNKHLTYIGTDPNQDHTIIPGITKYHQIAEFYRKNVNKGGVFTEEHTFTEIFQSGSEVIRNDPTFQRYKGKVHLVFTSPPYFMKEAYSQDDTQSYKKFGQYQEWVNGFLRPTLETAVEWLRPDGHLFWNIADAKFGDEMLPLEKDSCMILESLGMKKIEVLKMSLAQMPGGNRIDTETGLPKAKNFCKVGNIWLKYEPIFHFQKI